MRLIALSAVAICAFLGAFETQAQVYKCPDASGRLALQQTPCAGGAKLEVRPASGHDPVSAPQAVGGAAPSASASPKKGYADQLAEEREQRERWVRMNDARLAVDRERRTCDREQADLASRKWASNNNLAGATRDNAISGEMQAAATMCAGRLRSLEAEVTRMEADCSKMGCRRPGT
ncbi:hypothetical protein [Variovorax atrisoli]|uniref:hypothetical protein n=1 Tax=Variovorax atrisoli TaxID=3394203 RepID=UPI00339907F3